jgi:hypothetical protein
MEDLSDDEIDLVILSMSVWGNIDSLEDRIIELESKIPETWEERLEIEKSLTKAKIDIANLLDIAKKKGL